MQAARASEDPVTIASGARIVTHALMGSKHYKAAIDMARTLAAKFDHDGRPTIPSLCRSTARSCRGAR